MPSRAAGRAAPQSPREVTPAERRKPAPAKPEPKPESGKQGWGPRVGAVRASVAPAAIKSGPVGELEPMSAIVVANPDGFAPTRQLHDELAKALPSSTRLVVLQGKDHDDAWHGAAPKGALALKTSADSPWARDFAPTFVRTREGKLQAVEFKYGYAGADDVASKMAKKLGVPVISSPLIVEGGNLLADKGRLFVTDKLLENNKGMTRAQVETELKRALQLDTVEWMKPLPNEPTGHVDMYAKLIAPNTMLVSDTTVPAQKKVMDEAAARFKALGYEVVRATNAPTRAAAGDPQVKSYANALVINGTVFVPQYKSQSDDAKLGKAVAAADKKALEAYASAGLKTVPVHADELINFQGSVHCMTNALPAEVNPGKLR